MHVALLKRAPVEQRLLAARVRGAVPAMRIFPSPAPTPAIVHARTWYEQTDRRQWVFAAGIARRRLDDAESLMGD